MTYQEFTDKWNNVGCDFDGYYGFQCMDLAHQYASDVVGHDFAPAPAAKDVWNQTIDGYDKIENTPTGIPIKGDIIIWGTAIGAYGHIAVFDHGDSNTFTSFDQNWPLNSLCHFQNHNYTGVLGWFHPQKDVNSVPVVTPPPLAEPNPGYAPTFEGQTVSANGLIYHSIRPDGVNLVWETKPDTPPPVVETPPSTQTIQVPISATTASSGPASTITTSSQVPNPPQNQSGSQNEATNTPIDAPSQTTVSVSSGNAFSNFIKAILAWLFGK